jgi:hypothetical protein
MATAREDRHRRDPLAFVVALSGPAWAARLPNLLPDHTDRMRGGAERPVNGAGRTAADAITACSARRGIVARLSRLLSGGR